MWTENIWCIFREKLSFSNSSDVDWTENIWCVFRVKLPFLNSSGAVWTENIWCVSRVKLPFLNSSGAVWTVKLPFSNSFGVEWTGQRLFHHPITNADEQSYPNPCSIVSSFLDSVPYSLIRTHSHFSLTVVISTVQAKVTGHCFVKFSYINKQAESRKGGKDGIAKLEWNRAYITFKKVLDLLFWTFNFWTLFSSFWANFKQTFRTTCWNIARVSLRLQSMNWTEKSVK